MQASHPSALDEEKKKKRKKEKEKKEAVEEEGPLLVLVCLCVSKIQLPPQTLFTFFKKFYFIVRFLDVSVCLQ